MFLGKQYSVSGRWEGLALQNNLKSPYTNHDEHTIARLIAGQAELSLYVHIPYCSQKCDYCSFFSKPTVHSHSHPRSLPDKKVYIDPGNAVITRIINEIREAAALLGKPFKTLYIGGGNPGLLHRKTLQDILTASSLHGTPEEISIESNPESLDESLIELLADGKIDRLSLGVQSMSKNNLLTIGRNFSDPEQIRKILAEYCLPSRTWKLNIDLITGIPGQKDGDTENDMDEIISLTDPEHLSIYELSIEPGTPLFLRYNALPGGMNLEDLRDESGRNLRKIWRHATSLGYKQYEISNFARRLVTSETDKFHTCRHNQTYWAMKPYLGIGPGAASTLYADTYAVRIEAIADLSAYSENNQSLFSQGYKIEELTSLEFLEEKLIMGLRTSQGLLKKEFLKIFNVPISVLLPKTLRKLLDEGLAVETEDAVILTMNGKILLNTLLVEMFLEIDQSSKLVPSGIDLTAVFEL
jgi:oxygen-independent coproporphyrinogen III oxidase